MKKNLVLIILPKKCKINLRKKWPMNFPLTDTSLTMMVTLMVKIHTHFSIHYVNTYVFKVHKTLGPYTSTTRVFVPLYSWQIVDAK